MRPVLKPALRRLWRDPTTLQLGLTPEYAVVLGGVDVGDTSLIDLLDGTRELAEVSAEAQRRGHGPDRIAELVATLGAAAALDDAAAPTPAAAQGQPDLLSLSLLHREPGGASRVMASRGEASVGLLGLGRVGASVAMLLAAAGVGWLELTDSGAVQPSDFAPGGIRRLGARQVRRADAVRAMIDADAGRLGRETTGSKPDREPGAPPSVVVLAPTGSVVPPEWLGQVRHRPHLPVLIRETTALIGPFVLPGQTPCLRCLELTRGDRDPAWPVLAAQLIGERQAVEACDIALASAAASITALHVLTWLDRGITPPPPSVGGVVELSLTDLRLRRRTVAAHPGCGCGAIDAAPLT